MMSMQRRSPESSLLPPVESSSLVFRAPLSTSVPPKRMVPKYRPTVAPPTRDVVVPARVRASPSPLPPPARPAAVVGLGAPSFARDLAEANAVPRRRPTSAGGTRGGDAASPTPSAPSVVVEADVPDVPPDTAVGRPLHVPYAPDVRQGTRKSLLGGVARRPMHLRDYQILAEACQRAGKAKMEGHAYYKIGEALAFNKRDTLSKAVPYFRRYLNIARRLNDLLGEAKALNCLGVVHYEMGGMDNFTLSLEYHKQHVEVADATGMYIAYTNMGLTHAAMGLHDEARENLKQALQFSVRANDKAAEALALANLANCGLKVGDVTTARVCIERNVDLSTTMDDERNMCDSTCALGVLAGKRGEFAAAKEHFTTALEVAIRIGDADKTKEIRCQLGFVQAMLRMNEQMSAIASRMSV